LCMYILIFSHMANIEGRVKGIQLCVKDQSTGSEESKVMGI
jgi:hypothetical protein